MAPMMSHRTRALAAVLGIVVGSCLCCLPVHACSAVACISRGTELKSNFRVAVTFHDQPLAGVNIQVRGEGDVADFKTDANGMVRVSKLAPGDYWLTAEFLGISAAYECFHVNEHPSAKSRSKLKFRWGDEAPSTQQIAGKLIDSQLGKEGNLIWKITHKIEVPIVGANLKLQDATNGMIYLQTSDSVGQFDFGPLPNATYVLHIEGGRAGDRDYDTTDQLLALDAGASRSKLVFMRTESGCGGTYLEIRDP